MATKSLKVNFFLNALMNVSRVLFPLITAPYVSRVLSPEGLGLSNFAGTYTGYFALFAALGIPTHAMREIAKYRDDKEKKTKTVSEIFSLALILMMVVSVAYFFTVLYVDKIHNDALIFIITGLGLYLLPLDVSWYFTGEERFGFLTVRHLVVKIVGIICVFAFVHTKSDLLIYILANTLCGIMGHVWSFFLMLKDGIRIRFTIHGLTKHLRPSLILFASTIATTIYTMLDTIMLGFMEEYSEVAFYNCATNISKTLVGVVTSLSAVAVPRISYYLQNGEEGKINSLIGKSLDIVSYMSIPAAFGLACIAPTFAPLFYGDQYYGAILPLQIMSFVIIAIGLNNLTAWQTLIGLGKDKEFFYVVLVGAVINPILNLVLIPKFGAAGASAASVVAEIGVLAASIYVVRKRTFVRYSCISDMMKSLFVSILFIPLLMVLKMVFHGWVLVGVFCVTGFVLYLVGEDLMHNSASRIVRETAIETISKIRQRYSQK